MKILITGSLGFIATNLILKISQLSEHELVGIDSGISGSTNYEFTQDKCKHHIVDLRDRHILDPLLVDVDLVIHLAALGNVVESIEKPFENYKNNVESTLSLLESMRHNNVKRIIFSSTGGALMGNTPPPVSEASLPSPISPYGSSKLCCEAYLSSYSASYGFSCIALRFGNVYGPFSLHKKGVINKWIISASRREEIVLYGDGNSTRDYIHVDDLTNGILRSMNHIRSSNHQFLKFHLANNKEISLKTLLASIQSNFEYQLNVSYLPSRTGEVEKNFSDVSLASSVLGFSPVINIDHGIKSLCDWLLSVSSNQ